MATAISRPRPLTSAYRDGSTLPRVTRMYTVPSWRVSEAAIIQAASGRPDRTVGPAVRPGRPGPRRLDEVARRASDPGQGVADPGDGPDPDVPRPLVLG